MNAERGWIDRFEQAHAIWRYSEGGPHAAYDMADKHAGFYFNTDVVASDPNLIGLAAAELVEPFNDSLSQHGNYWVLTYVGSISASLVLAAHISRLLNKRLAYMDLRTGVVNFEVKKGDKALIVSDDVHSGGSIRRLLKFLSDQSASALNPVITLGNFSGATDIEGISIHSLIEEKIVTWTPANCPLCKGSSVALSARQKWADLLR